MSTNVKFNYQIKCNYRMKSSKRIFQDKKKIFPDKRNEERKFGKNISRRTRFGQLNFTELKSTVLNIGSMVNITCTCAKEFHGTTYLEYRILNISSWFWFFLIHFLSGIYFNIATKSIKFIQIVRIKQILKFNREDLNLTKIVNL